jgi:hypothetical protein
MVEKVFGAENSSAAAAVGYGQEFPEGYLLTAQHTDNWTYLIYCPLGGEHF